MLAASPGLTARAWAFAHLAHVAGHPAALRMQEPESIPTFALVLCAALQLARPTLAGHLGMLFALLARLLLGPAAIGSHAFLLVLIGTAAALHHVLRVPKINRARDHTAWLSGIYLASAFWKLNTDFLNPEVSCATAIIGGASLAVDGVSLIALASILVEVLLGAGLLFAGTRRLTCCAALAFHIALALQTNLYFEDFSALMVALVFATSTDRLQLGRLQRNVWRVLAMVFPVGLAFAAWNEWAFVALRNIGVCAGIVALCASWLRQPQTTVCLRSSWVGGVTLAILFANTLTPLLELKTAYSLNMYSNSVTAAGVSNHLLVRRTLDPLGLQRDRIHIEYGPSVAWRVYRDEGVWLTRSALKNAIGYEGREVCVRTQSTHGETKTTCETGERSLASKLTLFRRFTLGAPQKCRLEWGPAG